MRTLTIVLSSLFISSNASAADIGGTLSFEMSNVHNGDASWDLFSSRAGMPGKGIRGGVRVGDNLSVEGSWQRVRRGATVGSDLGDDGYYTYYEYDYDYHSELAPGEFRTAWFSDELGLGARLTQGIGTVLYPYVGADALFMRGVIKIDDDPSSKSNAGQIAAGGSALGGTLLGGIELRTPTSGDAPQLAIYIDGGYTLMQSLQFGDLGDMKPGGFNLHSGLGVRF